MDLKTLLNHVQHTLHMRVVIDKEGNYRVDIPDQNPDELQYKFSSKDTVEKKPLRSLTLTLRRIVLMRRRCSIASVKSSCSIVAFVIKQVMWSIEFGSK